MMKGLLAVSLIFLIFQIPTCFGMGLIFKKMKLDFKKGIIPFYNKIILIKYYKLPQYHLILIFIPLVALYSNYYIYQKMCKQFKKEFLYILQLTFFPFIYNIFLGLELKEIEQSEQIDNYFEDQKNLYEKSEASEEPNKIKEDEYIWQPKKIDKNKTIYKASRNNLNAKVNIQRTNSDEIIDNKINNNRPRKKNDNSKLCPKCGALMTKEATVCFLCGTKF